MHRYRSVIFARDTVKTYYSFRVYKMASHTTRRAFVLKVASVSTVLAAGGVLSGCGGGTEEPAFLYGVASGDPLDDRVILWTHAKFPSSTEPVDLIFEVAESSSFNTIISTGSVTASLATGFTAKVDAKGLTAGKQYFYRFRYGRTISPIGQTRTLPASATSLRMAVLSCSNYPAGYFNVYAEVAKSDCDIAVHLGDYIYEYPATGYASERAVQLNRQSSPTNELLTLEDYRKRHAQYKSDADAKALHARIPMIAVWDDHETANDAYKDGAENHDPISEGSWAERRDAALQAYHEWMPIRTGADKAKIYRSFKWGNLVDLHMLDTRLIGRDKQIDIAELAGLAGEQRRADALAAFSSPTRQMLGTEQFNWLQSQMASSTAKWTVLGQQVLMARMEFPASVLAALNTTDTSPEAQAAGLKSITDYLEAKAISAQAPELLTPTQKALLDPIQNPKLGYNLDAWDGYVVAREALLATALQLGKKLISLAGDTHNAWHSDLTLMGLGDSSLTGVKVGEEFATSSVSSPGLEAYLSSLPPAQIKAVFEGVVDDLQWMDASQRGFLKMSFSTSEVRGEWIFVSSIDSRSYSTSIGHTALMSF